MCHKKFWKKKHRKSGGRSLPIVTLKFGRLQRHIHSGGFIDMAATIKDNEPGAGLSIAAVDAAGNPAPVQNPVFTVTEADPSNPVLTLTDNGDGTGSVAATGKLGQATVAADADADLGEGVTNLHAEVLVDVVASQATGLTVTVTPTT